jgi:hypothetical protein
VAFETKVPGKTGFEKSQASKGSGLHTGPIWQGIILLQANLQRVCKGIVTEEGVCEEKMS